MYGAALGTVARVATEHRQIPEMFAAYNRREQPVELASFLTALSFLIATGTIEIIH